MKRMNTNTITVGTDFVHRCGERVFYRFDEMTALYNADRYGTHSCLAPDMSPIDWHECRHCPAAIFEIDGVAYDDSYGHQRHRCNRRKKQVSNSQPASATTPDMPPPPTWSTTTKRPQLWERDTE